MMNMKYVAFGLSLIVLTGCGLVSKEKYVALEKELASQKETMQKVRLEKVLRIEELKEELESAKSPFYVETGTSGDVPDMQAFEDIEDKMDLLREEASSTQEMAEVFFYGYSEYNHLIEKYFYQLVSLHNDEGKALVEAAQEHWKAFNDSERAFDDDFRVLGGVGTMEQVSAAQRQMRRSRERALELFWSVKRLEAVPAESLVESELSVEETAETFGSIAEIPERRSFLLDQAETTQDMIDAEMFAANGYEQFLEQYYRDIFDRLDEEDKTLLEQAQMHWKTFRDSEMQLNAALSDSQYTGGSFEAVTNAQHLSVMNADRMHMLLSNLNRLENAGSIYLGEPVEE